jgi:hypothetical protein
VAVGRERSHAASQQEPLELLYVAVGRGHGGYLRRAPASSCRSLAGRRATAHRHTARLQQVRQPRRLTTRPGDATALFGNP